MKPIIGVMPLWDDEKQSIWMLPGYLDGLRQAGGLPVVFPLEADDCDIHQLMELCSGFLFTGGHDVSPELYGEAPLDGTVSCCAQRDRLESIVLQRAIAQDKPVLGICRGIQFINAALGGTLYQDLPLQYPSEVEHHQQPPYDAPVHTVQIRKGTPLHMLLQTEELAVNSYHHQAVRRLADGLQSMAAAPDGLIEAVYKPDQKFLWAVQWHPEFSFRSEQSSRAIFDRFVQAML